MHIEGTGRPSLLVFLLAAALLGEPVRGQETLEAGRSVAADLSPAATRTHSLALNAGDLVRGSITQRGRTNLVIVLPDGRLMRRFPAPPADGRRQFGFVAEGAGTYRLDLTSTTDTAHYELTIDAIEPVTTRLAPSAWSDPYPSPRIEALRSRLAAGTADLEAFWRQASNEGLPWFEQFGSEGKYELVTFLWRGGPEIKNVYVAGSLNGPRLGASDRTMHRLDQTDVWYLTLRVPAGARFTYRLSPNDPLVQEGPRLAERNVTAQADPLNRHRTGCLPGASRYACTSIAESPVAIPQPWANANPQIRPGTITRHEVRSDILRMPRPIEVYTPSGYAANGPAPALLVVTDAEDYLSPDQALPTTLDNLIASHRIPPTVAVFIHNVADRRLTDLIPNEPFARFVASELVPWVRRNYHVTGSAQQTVIGGYSVGGLFAAYAGLSHPNVFGNVLSQSGSFWWGQQLDVDFDADRMPESNGMVDAFAKRPRLPLRFYLDAGTFEVGAPGPFGGLTEARRLRDVLIAKGYEVHFQQFVGGHDGLSWRGTVADGLIALLGSYPQRDVTR